MSIFGVKRGWVVDKDILSNATLNMDGKRIINVAYPQNPGENSAYKGCFTYTPNPNRNRTETVTATESHRFVFGRPFTYEPNPWTKCKKMPVYFRVISLSDSRNTFTTQIVSCHCIKFVVFIVALGIVPQNSVVNSIVLVK